MKKKTSRLKYSKKNTLAKRDTHINVVSYSVSRQGPFIGVFVIATSAVPVQVLLDVITYK